MVENRCDSGDVGYHAESGIEPYDSLTFSTKPFWRILASGEDCPTLIHHLGGGCGSEVIRTQSKGTHFDALLLTLSTSGKVKYVVGEQSIDRQLRRGNVSFVPAGGAGTTHCSNNHSLMIAYFPAGMLQSAMGGGRNVPIDPMLSQPHPRLAQLLGMLSDELVQPSAPGKTVAVGIIQAIAATLCAPANSAPVEIDQRIYISPLRLARVIDYMHHHLDQDISLSDLSAIAQLSPFHFSRVFKATVGETPYQYLCNLRIERACRLMQADQMSLAMVASAIGYSSQSHFTTVFSKVKGISPARYRRIVQRGQLAVPRSLDLTLAPAAST